ncbi:HPr family phosphocarrier protein [Fervidobacterium pennivorans subsp. shakshaketiis]|uniref:HPr family phosphocarrier protein n=1 Tax=Fervidobacterium TaxID=2422 RepID=UPI00355C4695
MKAREIILKNKSGLHARPAAVFVQAASKFKSKITIKMNEKEADGKSILKVLSLGANQGSRIVLEIDGEDEDEALKTLSELIETGLGEENG